MTQASTASLWVKAEIFSYGAIPIAPHPRLTFNNIKKIVIYAKNKGDLVYPNISYSVWKHIACNKLNLPEDLAWMYFSVCQMLSSDASAVEKIEWDQEVADYTDASKIESLKNKVAINTLKFVLFLYIQQIYKVSLKASLVAGDEWPSRASSPDLEASGRSTPRGNKTLDDHSHLVFVQNHIQEMLELLEESESSKSPGFIGLSTLEALGFLIAGSVDKCKSLLPIHDIACLQTIQHRTGFSKDTKGFNTKSLVSWIRDSLGQNPFGISCCIASGRRLSWPMAGEEKENKSDQSAKRGKIATNGHVVPKAHVKGNKILILSQVSKQTVARSSGTLSQSSVKIHRCHYSFLYLLSPLRSVTVEKSRNTTIVLGPVETTVYLSHCEKVTLIAPCRNVMISGSSMCTLYLLTPNRPMILGGNESITLAPYHTYYSALEDHMMKAGLSANRNLWDQPLCVGPEHKDDLPSWELLPVQEFFTFNIPFEVEGDTKDVPGGLPSKYQRAYTQRQKQIDTWQKTVKEAGLNREQRKEFQGLVESKFHSWLAETGYKRELDSLVSPVQSSNPKK